METQGLFSIPVFDTKALSCGLAIVLSEPVVSALVGLKRQHNEQLTGMLIEHIKSSGVGFCLIQVDYLDDSWLLQRITVNNHCACFSIDGETQSAIRKKPRAIRYTSHNLISISDVAVALSTWLIWFNNIVSLTDFRQPYKM